MTTTPSFDIGLFSKRTILTGAGWTRNWGGLLAGEMWQNLASDRRVRDRASVRELLLEERSFEAALGRLQDPMFDAQDRQTLESALVDTFVAMDAEIARTGYSPWINIYHVQDLLFRFWGQRDDRVNAGYMFTLNQDLWPERHLYNWHAMGAEAPSLPGLQYGANQCFFTANLGPYSNRFIMQPLSGLSRNLSLRGAFNIVKLHDSFNWRTPDGRNAIVIGTEKTSQITAVPLLAIYWQIFRTVLQAEDVRLMVVGYGFGDDHVNAEIANAVENHRLRLFIWDTAPDLMDRVLAAPHGAQIWKGVSSIASRPMFEVFPSNQVETAEYRRILTTMFE